MSSNFNNRSISFSDSEKYLDAIFYCLDNNVKFVLEEYSFPLMKITVCDPHCETLVRLKFAG